MINDNVNVSTISPLELRARIVELEKRMLDLPQAEMKLVHHFAPGTYMRELHIPKGCLLTGKIHLTEHLNILLKGDISVWTEEGVKRFHAPYILKSYPGAKRVGFAHEDSIWMTVHATDETDPDKIEAKITVNDFAEYERLTGSQSAQQIGEK